MKKKYFIRDEDENEYEVEEVTEKDSDEEETIEEVKSKDEDSTLTPDEIAALKSLAAIADKLTALVSNETTNSDEEVDELEVEEKDACSSDDEVEDADEEKEKVVKTTDSKKSFGANARKKRVADESLVDDVAEAWAKRYNGGNK